MKKLGSLSKSNPQKKEWSAMKLYLLEQVRPIQTAGHLWEEHKMAHGGEAGGVCAGAGLCY